MGKRIIGRVINYRGKKVKVIERANFIMEGHCYSRMYWVRAIEPVNGYEAGEELIISANHINNQI